MTRIVPQIATEIPATNNHTLRFRTNAAHARATRAARASRSISLKYSTMRPIKILRRRAPSESARAHDAGTGNLSFALALGQLSEPVRARKVNRLVRSGTALCRPSEVP